MDPSVIPKQNVESDPQKRAVVAIVQYAGEVLLGRKKVNIEKSMSGKWHIPGGTVETSETDEVALVREMIEEVGIKVTVGGFLGSHSTPRGTRVNWYLCDAKTKDIVAGSDLEEAKWVPFSEVMDLCDPYAISLWPKEVLEYFQPQDSN